jgi:hypothetical protein
MAVKVVVHDELEELEPAEEEAGHEHGELLDKLLELTRDEENEDQERTDELIEDDERIEELLDEKLMPEDRTEDELRELTKDEEADEALVKDEYLEFADATGIAETVVTREKRSVQNTIVSALASLMACPFDNTLK